MVSANKIIAAIISAPLVINYPSLNQALSFLVSCKAAL